MGSEALISLMLLKPNFEPIVIGIKGNQTCYLPLIEAVKKTKMINDALNEKNFDLAFQLRSPSFSNNLERYIKLSKCDFDPSKITHKNRKYNLAVLTMGAPSCGINSTIRSFVRQGIIKGCKIFGIQDGFEGFSKSLVKELDWRCVYGWTGLGGSILGSQRVDVSDIGFDKIAEKIRKFEIDGLLLIGGFDAFNSTLQLYEQRENYKEFCLPMIYVPATISNNIPGTDFTIGSDTALNEIVTVNTIVEN
jgi:6-phosphofructokinase 1